MRRGTTDRAEFGPLAILDPGFPPAVAAVAYLIALAVTRSDVARRLSLSGSDAYKWLIALSEQIGPHESLSIADASRRLVDVLQEEIVPLRNPAKASKWHPRTDANRLPSFIMIPQLGSIPISHQSVTHYLADGYCIAAGIGLGGDAWDAGRYAMGRLAVGSLSESDPVGAVLVLTGWQEHPQLFTVLNPVDCCFGLDGIGTLTMPPAYVAPAVLEMVVCPKVIFVEVSADGETGAEESGDGGPEVEH
jgi:hypothetical protein